MPFSLYSMERVSDKNTLNTYYGDKCDDVRGQTEVTNRTDTDVVMTR